MTKPDGITKVQRKRRQHAWKFTGANTGAHSYYICEECGIKGTREGMKFSIVPDKGERFAECKGKVTR